MSLSVQEGEAGPAAAWLSKGAWPAEGPGAGLAGWWGAAGGWFVPEPLPTGAHEPPVDTFQRPSPSCRHPVPVSGVTAPGLASACSETPSIPLWDRPLGKGLPSCLGVAPRLFPREEVHPGRATSGPWHIFVSLDAGAPPPGPIPLVCEQQAPGGGVWGCSFLRNTGPQQGHRPRPSAPPPAWP